ncbi:hypothetical protein [Leptodesmis sp.]|uniref:hypothetical protein n=1 Tax=Leptodesmis sp. TaxID=3100501 RepID=UPI0040535481
MPKLPIEQDRPRSSRALSLSRNWMLWESWVVAMALAQVVGLEAALLKDVFYWEPGWGEYWELPNGLC